MRRNGGGTLRSDLAQLFETCEKEHLILAAVEHLVILAKIKKWQRPTDGSPKLMSFQRLFAGESVISIENVISDKLEKRAREPVRTGFRDYADLSSCKAPVLGAVGGGRNLEFLD